MIHNAKKRPPSTETCSSVKDERMINYPRYHLVSQFALCALRNICIFPATDVCPTSQNTEPIRNNDCSLRPQRSIWQPAFPSGSHHPGLSVGALLLLSPLQRFISLFIFYKNTTHLCVCQQFTRIFLYFIHAFLLTCTESYLSTTSSSFDLSSFSILRSSVSASDLLRRPSCWISITSSSVEISV